MKVFEALARAVVAEGTDVVFTFMDSSTLDLVQALHEGGLRIIHARHEQGAVVMADGYARATGQVGFCTVGAGPALAQTGTGLVTARKGRSPVLVIAGDTPSTDRAQIKAFDQRSYVEATAGYLVPLRGAATVTEDVHHAFRHVRNGRGPVVLNAPADVLRSEYPMDFEYRATSEMPGPFHVAPDPEAVELAAAMLANARRPVVIAGKGAVLSGAKEEIEALGARIGALLGTTLLAQAYFRGHPFDIGVLGDFANASAVELLAQADCVLAVGASLNPYTTGGGRVAPRAKVMHIDVDPTRFNEFTPVDLGIAGDARASVAAINSGLEMAGVSDRMSYWSNDQAQAAMQASRLRPSVPDHEPARPLHPAQVLSELDKILPEKRLVVIGGGVARRDRALGTVFDHITVPGADALVRTGDFGSIGLGLAMGIGAAVGRPERHCVIFEGDGGFMMHVQELETAARCGIPLTMVVLNDAAYGAEAWQLRSKGKPPDLALVRDIDLAEVAQAFGVRGVTVRNMADLDAVGVEMQNEEGPLLIDVKIRTPD